MAKSEKIKLIALIGTVFLIVLLFYFSFQLFMRGKGFYSDACEYILGNDQITSSLGKCKSISPLFSGSCKTSRQQNISTGSANIVLDLITENGLHRVAVAFELIDDEWQITGHRIIK